MFGPTHRSDGRYSTFWALSSLKNIEDFGAKGPDAKSKQFQKLLRDFRGFREPDSKTGFSQLYQVAAGTPMY